MIFSMRTAIRCAGGLFFSSALLLHAEPPAPWPQFRGPNATGIAAPDARPPVEFDSQKNCLWKVEVPPGGSSPVIWGGRVFLTGFASGKLETLCIQCSDGTLLWKREAKAEAIEPFFDKFGTPAGPSCATDGEHVVTYFGSCGLVCHDFEGKELWSVPMPVIRSADGFGTGNSPVIFEGLVYLLRDEQGDAGGLYAFNVKTGKEVWHTSRKEFQVSYCTPVVWDGALVCIGELRAKAYDLKTGRERWWARGLSAYPCTTAAAGPDGNLYIATWSSGSGNEPNPEYDELLVRHDGDKSGDISLVELADSPLRDFLGIMDDNQNNVLERWEWDPIQSYMRTGKNAVLCIKPGGLGDVTDSHVVWQNERGASYVSSPLAYEDRLFLAKDGGFATCYEAHSGKLLYEKQRLGAEGDYYASPVFAAGKIYAASSRGTVVVLDAAADKLTVLARNVLGELLLATPAIVGNAIYVRTGSHLRAFTDKTSLP
ncbi:MAG: outer rane biosis protein BamB [Chthoniobacteraceae bacterium]|nr:outer rane biosis protein BamB [Chthoniobacteraceae bacterium]